MLENERLLQGEREWIDHRDVGAPEEGDTSILVYPDEDTGIQRECNLVSDDISGRQHSLVRLVALMDEICRRSSQIRTEERRVSPIATCPKLTAPFGLARALLRTQARTQMERRLRAAINALSSNDDSKLLVIGTRKNINDDIHLMSGQRGSFGGLT